MSRSYRSIFFALGLALSSANHAYAEGSKQQQPEQSIAKSLSDIAASNDQQSERAKRTEQDEVPCRQRQYGSSADLCAQWKAADAAADSAWWAWVAGISTIISTAAVIFAIALTYQANSIARDTAKRQLRAYLGFHSAWIEESGDLWQFKLINNGQTPAKNVAVKTVTIARGTADSAGMEKHQLGQIDPAYKRRGMIRTPAVVVQNGNLCMGVRVVATAFYEDSFGERWCRRQIFELSVGDASIDGTDADKHYLHLRTSRERKVPSKRKA